MAQTLQVELLLPQRGGPARSVTSAPFPSPDSLHRDSPRCSFAFSSSTWRWSKLTKNDGNKSYDSSRRRHRGGMVVSIYGQFGGPKTISSDRGSVPPASTAKEAVETGLSLFSKGRVKDALDQFNAALKLNPEPEEAQAALYNKACCHAYREEGAKAADALRQALSDYALKFSVILNDPDMAPFRAMPEFKQLQDEARKGGEEVGQSFRRDLKLISEVQAPFRGVRRFFYVAFTLAAGISTLLTVPRFVLALQGGEGSPSLLGTSQNLAINLGGMVVSVALFLWDNKKEEEQIARITRDETLSRLPLRIQTNRIIELSQIRETTRPVIIAGGKNAVTKALQQAQRCRDDLLKRGVLVIPIVWSSEKSEPVKKRGFGNLEKPPIGDDFENRAADIAAKAVIQADRRFKAEAVSAVEWERWIRDQQESDGVTPGTDVYIVLRLDGRVRKSGVGMPDWQDLINTLPPLDALISKLEK